MPAVRTASRSRRVTATAVATGVGTAPGTFGELLQGVLHESNLDFLVTLPIARGSVARFRLDPTTRTVCARPETKRKARQLVTLMLEEYGVAAGGSLDLWSDLPEGKGLASSSADLVATARAVGHSLGLCLEPAELEPLLRLIEPSDGVMYQGAVAFYHRRVELHSRLGDLPPLTIVGVDEGGEVDTVAFNRTAKPFSTVDKREYSQLLARISSAVRGRDAAAIGAVATRSAVLNQRLSHKGMLDELIRVSESIPCLGVVAAHSGTALGLLLDERDPQYRPRLKAAWEACLSLAGSVWVDRTHPAVGTECGRYRCQVA
jgi:uncharacterized protein involved in propanediol utilization